MQALAKMNRIFENWMESKAFTSI